MVYSRIIPNFPLISVFVFLLIFWGTANSAEAPEAADPCFECHGDKGVNKDSDKAEIPTIAGPSAFYLENQIKIFQEEARPCEEDKFEDMKEELEEDLPVDDHCALAEELSEDDAVALADYFASQDFVPADQSVDPQLAKTGEKVHERRCDKCHAKAGTLTLDDAGILAGQWKPYLREQLHYYKEGERWQPEKKQLKTKKLDDKKIEALVEYYASEGSKRF